MITLIQKAKANLIRTQPFFATLILGLPVIEDKSIPTMATDGESIRYNPQWTEKLTLDETVFVLAHETLHVVFQHMTRRGSKNPNRWNIAADYIINDVLVKEKIGVMPKGGLLDSALVAKAKGTAEGVYNLLPKESENNTPGSSGGSLDDCRDAGSHNVKDGIDSGDAPKNPDPAKLAQKEAEMRVKITQAKNAAKMRGNLSAGLERIVSEMTKTRTDWRELLRRFFAEKIKSEYSFARPKRRFLASDLYLPSLIGEGMGEIIIAVDCSGSIDEKILGQFSSEMNSIIQDVSPKSVSILYFDAQILRHELREDFDGSPIELKPIGGGGTAFSPIFEFIDLEGLTPKACVILTDLECHDFGAAPDFPVLWASTSGERLSAPFGEVISIEREES